MNKPLNQIVLILLLTVGFIKPVLSQQHDLDSLSYNDVFQVDTCEYYKFIVKGDLNVLQIDTLLLHLKSYSYKSKELNSVLFFQKNDFNNKIYLNCKRTDDFKWHISILCNPNNLDDDSLNITRGIVNELLNKLYKVYAFDEIYFYCTYLEL